MKPSRKKNENTKKSSASEDKFKVILDCLLSQIKNKEAGAALYTKSGKLIASTDRFWKLLRCDKASAGSLSDVFRYSLLEKELIKELNTKWDKANLSAAKRSKRSTTISASSSPEDKKSFSIEVSITNSGEYYSAILVKKENLPAGANDSGLVKLIESLHEAIPTGVMAFEDTGKIIYANTAFCEMIGYQRKELLWQKPPYSFWPPEEIGNIIAAYQLVLEKPKRKSVFELVFSKKNGIRLNVQVFVSRIEMPDGAAASVCSIIDITERKILNRRLKESEYLYRSIADNMNDVIWLCDTATWQYTYLSPSVKNILGYESAELIGSNIAYTLDDEQKNQLVEIAGSDIVSLGQNPGFPRSRYFAAQQIKKNGTIISTEIKLQYIVDKGNEVNRILGITRDISDRVKLENKLRASERISKEAQKITEIGFWEYDVSRDTLIWSDEIYRIFDVNPAAFHASYKNFLSLVHPDDRDIVNTTYINSLKERKPYAVDHRLLMPDGKIKWVREAGENIFDKSGKPLRTIGSVQNITEKKLTENQLLFTQYVVEHSSEATFWIKPDGEIFYVNKSACDELRYSFEELISLKLQDIDPTFTLDEWERVWKSSKSERIFRRETLYRRKDGSVFPVEIRANIVDYAGETYMCAYVYNITARKEYEQKLRENESKFRGLFESSVDGIAIADERGIFLDANIAFLNLVGYTREELLWKHLAFIHPEESFDFISEEFNQLYYGIKQHSPEIPILKKDGSIIYVSITTFNMQWGEKKSVVGIFTDVSEMKRLNDSLERSVLRYKRAMETDQAGIFELNLKTGKFSASQAFYKTLEFEKNDDDADTSGFLGIIIEEDRQLMQIVFDESRLGIRDSFLIEYRIRRKDGLRWIRGRGRVFEKDKQGRGELLIGTIEDVTDLKSAQEKLLEEKERLERISDALPGAVMKFKLKADGALFIPYASRRVEDVFGVEVGEITNDFSNFSRRINDTDLYNLFEKVILSAQTQQPWNAQYRFHNPVKGWVWIETKSIPHRDAENNVVWYGYADDVTERKKSDFQIQQLQERFSIAFHSSPAALMISSKEDGKIIDVNEAFCEVTGFSREDTLGRSAIELNLYDTSDHWEEMLSRLSENNNIKNLEQTIFTKSRETRQILISAELIELDNADCLLSFFFDITDRNQMLDALRESEARYRLISENVSDVIWTMKSDANKFSYISPSVKKLLGYTTEEVLERPLNSFVTPESLRQFKEHTAIRLRKFLASPQSGKYFVDQIDHPTKWGRIVTTEVSSTFTMNNEGEVEIIGVTRDITERKFAEEKIKQLNADLEIKVKERTSELQRSNQELESFAYSISHDLRAPLRAIDGFSVILQEEYMSKLDDEARSYFARIRSNINRMGQMIEDLLRLSRIMRSEMNISEFDITNLAKNILSRHTEAEPARRVNILLPGELKIRADKNLIEHLLENLLSNAWKFSSKREEAKIEFSADEKDGTIIFAIKDNGAGFDMNYANKLFGVFQRLHSPNEFPGIGIGLALVQRIVNRHGGKIWAEGEVDKGAAFYFTLPLFNNVQA